MDRGASLLGQAAGAAAHHHLTAVDLTQTSATSTPHNHRHRCVERITTDPLTPPTLGTLREPDLR